MLFNIIDLDWGIRAWENEGKSYFSLPSKMKILKTFSNKTNIDRNTRTLFLLLNDNRQNGKKLHGANSRPITPLTSLKKHLFTRMTSLCHSALNELFMNDD